jgi:hypothetical protein
VFDLAGYQVPTWNQMIDDLALEILEREEIKKPFHK